MADIAYRSQKTPRKNSVLCCVCGDIPKEKRRVASTRGKEKNLVALLLRYGEINVVDGVICRKCHDRLINIDNNVVKFKNQCDQTQKKSKRCATEEPEFEECSNPNNTVSYSFTPVSVKQPLSPVYPFNTPVQVNQSLSPANQSQTPASRKCLYKENISTSTPCRSIVPKPPLTPRTPLSEISHSFILFETPKGKTNKPSKKSKVSTTSTLDTSLQQDHGYATVQQRSTKKKTPNSSKKQRNRKSVDEIPHISQHDHNYFLESTKEKEDFQISDTVLKLYDIAKPKSLSCTVLSKEDSVNLARLIDTYPVDLIAEEMLSCKKLADGIEHLIKQYRKTISEMGNIKHGFVSCLMKKDYESMKAFSWETIVMESFEQFPLLMKVILGTVLPADKLGDVQNLKQAIPRLGMIYAIMTQGRRPELSLVQRVMSVILVDNICDQKVFDRLQPAGICLSHQQTNEVLCQVGGTFNNRLIDALKAKKRIRFVGDNVNYTIKIHEQHMSDEGKTKKMHHAFASAALIHNFDSDMLKGLSVAKPQKHWRDLTVQDFLMNVEDYANLKKCYTIIICQVASKFIPALHFMSEVVPEQILGPHSHQLARKTEVVPLETMQKNEQYYADVVDILDYYEKVIADTFEGAGIPLHDDSTVHIGGDQLTRERFSGAKSLRVGAQCMKQKLGHLKPITFEMFHLLMNFLIAFLKFLHNDKSSQELGTLQCEVDRIMRSNFDPDVKKAYDSDRDMVVSFVDCHIIELVCHFFGLEDVYGKPKLHEPPHFVNSEDKKKWVFSTIGQLVEEFILPAEKACQPQSDVLEDGHSLPIHLADGTIIFLPLMPLNKSSSSSIKPEAQDHVKNYAHRVLEMGLVYKELLEVCHIPDRQRIIRLMKQCLVIFKAKSNHSKYAVEVHRFLVQQLSLLSELEAHEVVYSMFVNTKGNVDSHIPADLQMEYLVKLIKKHIKHMYSNKAEENITKKTRSLSCVQAIAQNYDTKTSVKIRAKKHAHANYRDDERIIIEDLRTVKPFSFQPGRAHRSFPNIPQSVAECINVNKLHDWIRFRTLVHATEIGQ